MTPSHHEIKVLATLEGLSVPIHVLIRPRAGGFVYDDSELDQMKSDIEFCKQFSSIRGIVFGILTADGQIDKKKCHELVKIDAPELTCTFHRVFDSCGTEPFCAVDLLIELGFTRVLTSGKEATALEGATLLAELCQHVGNNLIIMPGGGIRLHNILDIIQQTQD